MIIAEFENHADGVKTQVLQVAASTFTVILIDTDAGETFPMVHKTSDIENATQTARAFGVSNIKDS